MYVTGHFCRLFFGFGVVFFFFQCTNPVQHKDKSKMTFDIPSLCLPEFYLSSLPGFKAYATGCYQWDKHVICCLKVIQLQETVLPTLLMQGASNEHVTELAVYMNCHNLNTFIYPQETSTCLLLHILQPSKGKNSHLSFSKTGEQRKGSIELPVSIIALIFLQTITFRDFMKKNKRMTEIHPSVNHTLR